MIEKVRVGVLMGGVSSERQISLKSGKAVLDALKSLGFEALAVDIRMDNKRYVKDLILSYDIGLAFLAMHGPFGEDGKVQSILEELRIAYTGSGPESSALAMDKAASSEIFRRAGLNVPGHLVLDKNHRRITRPLRYPLVVKPVCGGSSIGLSIVDEPKAIKPAIDLAFEYDKRIIVEEYIQGREMTVGILDNKALEVVEIRAKNRFFDYKAKYQDSKTEYIVPAEVPSAVMRLLKDAAVRAHNLLGCSFFSRVDIILSDGFRPFILEVNTIPGFTSTSLLPKAALCAGISFPDLIFRISRAFCLIPRKKSRGLGPGVQNARTPPEGAGKPPAAAFSPWGFTDRKTKSRDTANSDELAKV